MKPQCWLWPDHTIAKAESRQLREEHNALVNENERLREALRECITNDGANCLAYGADTPTLRRRLSSISNTARAALAESGQK